jgi:FkbM family methyltransferase
MIPKVLHRSVGQDTTEEEERDWEQFRGFHPTWELRTWRDPLTCSDFELGHLFDKCHSREQLADLVRLEVLWRYGGIYVGADCAPVQPLDPLLAYHCFIGTEEGTGLCNAVMGCEPAHPAMRACMDLIISQHRVELDVKPHLSTGSELVTAALGDRDDVTVLPPEFFYAYRPSEPQPSNIDAVATPFTYIVHKSRGPGAERSNPRRLRTQPRRIRARALAPLYRARAALVTPPQLLPGMRGTYVGNGRVLVRLPNGKPMFALANDRSLTPELLVTGVYDRPFWEFLRRVVRPGDHVVDVGANVGLFTLAMADAVQRFGRVYAYEPDPELHAVLKENITCNWLADRVLLLPMAAWSIDGEVAFHACEELRLCSVAGEIGDWPSELYGPPSPVPCERLDSRLPKGIPLRLVKIDVEGGERHVLEGLWPLLEAGQVRMVDVEVDRKNAGDGWGELVAMLRRVVDLGASTYTINDRGLVDAVTLDQVVSLARATQHLLLSFVGDPTR